MKKLIGLFLLVVLCGTSAYAYEAFTYTFIIDASGSVSESDFEEANENIAEALAMLYAQAERNPGEDANFVSVAWFGGEDDYNYTNYCNGSNYDDMNYAYQECLYKTHPKYGATAIYSAILYGTLTAMDFEDAVGWDYLNVIFLITDGEDGDSPADHKEMIENYYPNNDAYLCVIGVGSGAKIGEFKSIADDIVSINGFGELFDTIAYIQENL